MDASHFGHTAIVRLLVAAGANKEEKNNVRDRKYEMHVRM